VGGERSGLGQSRKGGHGERRKFRKGVGGKGVARLRSAAHLASVQQVHWGDSKQEEKHDAADTAAAAAAAASSTRAAAAAGRCHGGSDGRRLRRQRRQRRQQQWKSVTTKTTMWYTGFAHFFRKMRKSSVPHSRLRCVTFSCIITAQTRQQRHNFTNEYQIMIGPLRKIAFNFCQKNMARASRLGVFSSCTQQ